MTDDSLASYFGDGQADEGVTPADYSSEEIEAKRSRQIVAAAMMVARAKEAMEHHRDLMKQAEDEIDRLLPAEEGEVNVSADGTTVVIARSTKYVWDKNGLEKRFGDSADCPDCITKSYTVSRPKFDRMHTSDREALEEFLTVELNRPRIKAIIEK